MSGGMRSVHFCGPEQGIFPLHGLWLRLHGRDEARVLWEFSRGFIP